MRDSFFCHSFGFRGELAAAVTTLTQAIADTNTHMRVLHEDTLSRTATIGERRKSRKKQQIAGVRYDRSV